VRRLLVEPVTRIEGEGKLHLFLDERGEVREALFQMVEIRGFEHFCIGRKAEEAPRLSAMICGICPWAHSMASVKAADALFGRVPPDPARKLRELALHANLLDSHTLHFHALIAPDLLLPGADRAERNLLGLLRKCPELVKEFFRNRKDVVKVEKILGGKLVHPISLVPGGITKRLREEERAELEDISSRWVAYAVSTLERFEEVLKRKLAEMSDLYYCDCYSMGLVDERGNAAYYGGELKVIDPAGRGVARFSGMDYKRFIEEFVHPWSYSKFPYLRGVGWRGFRDGPESGVYRVGPLARVSVSDGFSTELANEAYGRMVDFAGKPIRSSAFYNWARLIEILHASERMVEIARDASVTSSDIVSLEGEWSGVGAGVVEAPRGTLIHHYEADERAILTKVNIITPTAANNAAMNTELTRVARGLVHGGTVPEEVLNRVELALRNYDPCLSCSTHALGGFLLRVIVHGEDGGVVKEVVFGGPPFSRSKRRFSGGERG